jgi:hypothetical protein
MKILPSLGVVDVEIAETAQAVARIALRRRELCARRVAPASRCPQRARASTPAFAWTPMPSRSTGSPPSQGVTNASAAPTNEQTWGEVELVEDDSGGQ